MFVGTNKPFVDEKVETLKHGLKEFIGKTIKDISFDKNEYHEKLIITLDDNTVFTCESSLGEYDYSNLNPKINRGKPNDD